MVGTMRFVARVRWGWGHGGGTGVGLVLPAVGGTGVGSHAVGEAACYRRWLGAWLMDTVSVLCLNCHPSDFGPNLAVPYAFRCIL